MRRVALGALLVVSACSSPSLAPPVVTIPSYWQALLLAGPHLVSVQLVGDTLVVGDRWNGVSLQSPAFGTDWASLGLSLPEYENSDFGLRVAAAGQGQVRAGLELPVADARGRLQELGAGGWEGSSFPAESPVSGLLPMPGGWVGVDDAGRFLSTDGGLTWRRGTYPGSGVTGSGRLFQGQGGFFWGGTDTNGAPELFWSEDGESWLPVPTPKTPGSSVQWAAGNRTRFWLTIGFDVFLTVNGGQVFNPVLAVTRLPGAVFPDPEDPDQVLVVGQFLYHTLDAGQSWDAYPPPPGVVPGPSVMCWEKRRAATLVTDGFTHAVFAFDLDEAIRVTGDP